MNLFLLFYYFLFFYNIKKQNYFSTKGTLQVGNLLYKPLFFFKYFYYHFFLRGGFYDMLRFFSKEDIAQRNISLIIFLRNLDLLSAIFCHRLIYSQMSYSVFLKNIFIFFLPKNYYFHVHPAFIKKSSPSWRPIVLPKFFN